MKEKKIFVIAIGIMVIMLVGIIAAEEIPTNIGEGLVDRIVSYFRFIFHQSGKFTMYGVEMKCSSEPNTKVYLTSAFLSFQPNQYFFASEKTCGDKSFFVNYFRGQPGHDQYIKEIYYYKGKAYITDGDGKGGIYTSPSIKCDAGAYWDNKCYVEIYCCPYGACQADSECSSGESCKDASITLLFPELKVCQLNEVPTYQTKVYQCLENGSAIYLKSISYGDKTYSFCPEGKNNYLTIGGTSSGVCYTTASEACKTQTGTQSSKSIPLTEDEWSTATPKMIVAAMCQVPSDCAEREGYTVKCIFSEDIQKINENALEKVDPTLKTQICSFMKFSWSDIGIMGISKIILWVSGGSYAYKYLCNNEKIEISGTCRAEEKETDGFSAFFKSLAFFDITGDGKKDSTDGMIIFFGGIIILIFLISMMGGGRR